MHEIIIDQLDKSITALLAGDAAVIASMAARDGHHGHSAPLRDLLQIAARLHTMPRPEFRARLRDELEQRDELNEAHPELAKEALSVERQASSPIQPAPRNAKDRDQITPPLFLTGPSTLPIRGSHLALSFTLHVAALVLIISSGWWMVQNRQAVRTRDAQLMPTNDDYLLPVAPGVSWGGGGGGDRDILPASHGRLPR